MSGSRSLCVELPKSACVPVLGVWVGVMQEAFGSMDRPGLGLALVSSESDLI